MWGDVGRCGEIWEDKGRYGEIWRDMARYGEIWEDTGRCGEIWGDMGRSRRLSRQVGPDGLGLGLAPTLAQVGPDGRAGEQPRFTNVSSNLVHELGIHQQQS